jgi:hypothetical protein
MYPKWIKESEHIGAVLVLNAEEEAEVRAVWKDREPKAEAPDEPKAEAPKRGRPKKTEDA